MTFSARFSGCFRGVLQWQQLDRLWARVRGREGWYVYLVGHAVPRVPESPESLDRVIGELDALLRREHDHDYCGIVYADSLDEPTLIKVFDPHNLGSSCGSSGLRILPRWVLSRLPPTELQSDEVLPAGRRRWWSRLFHPAS